MTGDAFVIAFVAILAVALAVALGIAWSRGRTLEAIGESLDEAARADADAPDEEELVDRVRRLRRRADLAEFRLEQRLRDLAYLTDLVGVGIVRLTDDLRVEIANTAAHVFLQREPGSMLGRTAIEAFGDHRVEDVARRARDDGSATEEVTIQPRRAGDRPAGESTLIVRARRSPILGVWLVLQDVAELRRLQRIRAEFIDNLSHELRTPITTIGLLTEALARDAASAGHEVPARMRERISKLEVETADISQMVSELLDLTRIESGGRLHLDDVDVGQVVAESAERLRPFAERQGIGLHVAQADDLPRIRGDAARLGQVFANLIHNAIKFSKAGDMVEVGVRPEGDGVAAWVRDHGVGIRQADQARIFERFYKVDRSRSRGGGTGLGLAIARHIVESHAGSIDVESAEGLGSTFTVSLRGPAAAPSQAPDVTAAPIRG
jgi:two-component system phosphate regulon sensor histidine kinase PhoR